MQGIIKSIIKKGNIMEIEKKMTHFTKQELLQHLSKKTGLSKKNIHNLLNELLLTIKDHMKTGGPETFVLPGIFKLITKNVIAQEERIGINPFTKEKMVFKAKPAMKKIKIKILKGLKNIK